MPRKFYLREHLHKGKAYISALEGRGYERTDNYKRADFAFFDHDISWQLLEHRPECYACKRLGIPFFIYPHAARSGILWDLYKAWPHTAAQFVHAEGWKTVMQRVKYPCPIEVTGWTYSNINPFIPVKPVGKPKVLFGPIHPMGNGYLYEVDRKLNFNIFKFLVSMLADIDLTVRYCGEMGQNGIWPHKKVAYVHGKTDGSTKEIEEADLVIGSFTFAYLGIALGKPTIMFGEKEIPHGGVSDLNMVSAKNWHKYKKFIEYPFNICDVLGSQSAFYDMMTKAMKGTVRAENWRNKFVGKPFDPDYFVDRVEAYL